MCVSTIMRQMRRLTITRSSVSLIYLMICLLQLVTGNAKIAEIVDCPPEHGFDDIASRTILAKTVFVGTFVKSIPPATSMLLSNDVKLGPTSFVAASFKIEKIYKGGETFPREARVVVGGRVASASSLGAGDQDCAGLKNLQEKTSYLVFLDGSVFEGGGTTVHWELGPPEVLTKREDRIVEKLSCPKCKGRPPKAVISPSGALLRRFTETKFRLKCEVTGNPPPRVVWFKNGEEIGESEHIHTSSLKMASELIIKKARVTDSGTYWCRAANILNQTLSQKVKVNISEVMHIHRKETSDPCSPEMSRTFCLNEGSCYMTKSPDSRMHCRCTKQFQGLRCEERVPFGPVTTASATVNPFMICLLVVAVLILFALLLVIYYLARLSRKIERHKGKSKGTGDDDNSPLFALMKNSNKSNHSSPYTEMPYTNVEIRPHNSRQTSIIPSVVVTETPPNFQFRLSADMTFLRNASLPCSTEHPQRSRSRLSAVSNMEDAMTQNSAGSRLRDPDDSGSQSSPDSSRALISYDACDSVVVQPMESGQSTLRSKNKNAETVERVNDIETARVLDEQTINNNNISDSVDLCADFSVQIEQRKTNLDEVVVDGELPHDSLTSSRGYGSLGSLENVTATDAAVQRKKVEEINDLIKELDIDPEMYLSPPHFDDISFDWSGERGALTVKRAPSGNPSDTPQIHSRRIYVK